MIQISQKNFRKAIDRANLLGFVFGMAVSLVFYIWTILSVSAGCNN